jgi:Protein of unknown function
VIPAREIDELLLSFCDVRWLKVARIIGKAQQTFEERGVRVAPDELDARMAILVSTRQLEAKGNIRNWRYSEVRLPVAGE